MATSRYGKGSWIYKLLIILLTVALIGSIYLPKKLWQEEAKNVEECRTRMNNIFNAALFYQHFNADFTDSLEQLIEFLKTDSTYHAYVDSVVGKPLNVYLLEIDTLRQRQHELEATFPSVDPLDSLSVSGFYKHVESIVLDNRLMRDKLEALREEMKRHPYFPLNIYDGALDIIERKDFFLQYEVIRNMIMQNTPQFAVDASNAILGDYTTITDKLNETLAAMPDMYTLADSLHACPTTHNPYKLSVEFIDTTNTIRQVVVDCPIDSAYIESVNADFMLSTIGALTVENHGNIKGGDRSWEDQK